MPFEDAGEVLAGELAALTTCMDMWRPSTSGSVIVAGLDKSSTVPEYSISWFIRITGWLYGVVGSRVAHQLPMTSAIRLRLRLDGEGDHERRAQGKYAEQISIRFSSLHALFLNRFPVQVLIAFRYRCCSPTPTSLSIGVDDGSERLLRIGLPSRPAIGRHGYRTYSAS